MLHLMPSAAVARMQGSSTSSHVQAAFFEPPSFDPESCEPELCELEPWAVELCDPEPCDPEPGESASFGQQPRSGQQSALILGGPYGGSWSQGSGQGVGVGVGVGVGFGGGHGSGSGLPPPPCVPGGYCVWDWPPLGWPPC